MGRYSPDKKRHWYFRRWLTAGQMLRALEAVATEDPELSGTVHARYPSAGSAVSDEKDYAARTLDFLTALGVLPAQPEMPRIGLAPLSWRPLRS